MAEWYSTVPGVLGAIQRAVDNDPRPGRFLVTGSAWSDLEGDLWPGTGRLIRVQIVGKSIREQQGRGSA